MSYDFDRATLKDVGTTAETIYTAPAGVATLCMALNLANTTSAAVKVTVILHDAATSEDVDLLRDVGIPVSSALPAFGRQKHILKDGDYITIQSDTPDSIDALMSFIEDINSI